MRLKESQRVIKTSTENGKMELLSHILGNTAKGANYCVGKKEKHRKPKSPSGNRSGEHLTHGPHKASRITWSSPAKAAVGRTWNSQICSSLSLSWSYCMAHKWCYQYPNRPWQKNVSHSWYRNKSHNLLLCNYLQADPFPHLILHHLCGHLLLSTYSNTGFTFSSSSLFQLDFHTLWSFCKLQHFESMHYHFILNVLVNGTLVCLHSSLPSSTSRA